MLALDKQTSQAKQNDAIASNTRQLFVGQAVSVRNYRGKEKWIQGIVRARTGPVSYQVEVAPNVIWKRHIDQLLASENNRDLQPVTDIPALANESNAAGETPVDMQDQQETPEPNQEMDEEEQPRPEQRYPSKIRQEPIRLGHDS